eukprot:UC4_evm3s805
MIRILCRLQLPVSTGSIARCHYPFNNVEACASSYRGKKTKPGRPKMELLLKEDHVRLGQAGTLTKVKRGYGRNYLIPRGIAVYPTQENRGKFELSQKDLRATAALKKAKEIFNNVHEATIDVPRTAGEEIFISREIVHVLAADKLNIDIPVERIHMNGIISSTGSHNIKIDFPENLVADLKLNFN